MKRVLIITALTAAYGIVGAIERGWFDWHGMLAVGLLITALGITIMKGDNDA